MFLKATYRRNEMQRCRGPGTGRTGTEMLTEMLDLSVLVRKITDTICNVLLLLFERKRTGSCPCRCGRSSLNNTSYIKSTCELQLIYARMQNQSVVMHTEGTSRWGRSDRSQINFDGRNDLGAHFLTST